MARENDMVNYLRRKVHHGEELPGIDVVELYGDRALFPEFGNQTWVRVFTKVGRQGGRIQRGAQRGHWKVNKSWPRVGYTKTYLTFNSVWKSTAQRNHAVNLNMDEYELHGQRPDAEGREWVICELRLGRQDAQDWDPDGRDRLFELAESISTDPENPTLDFLGY